MVPYKVIEVISLQLRGGFASDARHKIVCVALRTNVRWGLGFLKTLKSTGDSRKNQSVKMTCPSENLREI